MSNDLNNERNLVRLVVGGMEYGGWRSVRIDAGLERQARSFSLETTRQWPGATNWFRVKPGMACEIYIGPDLVLTGYVDATPIDYDGRSVRVGVMGRSKTADLVDCCPVTPPTQWAGQTMEAIAAALAAPYGVEVVAEVPTGGPFATFALQMGETVFEAIDRMMRLRQVLSTDDARGRLVFIDAGGKRASTPIAGGVNVLRGAAALDFKDVYTQYVCKSQRSGLGGDFGVDVSEAEGEVDDTPAVAEVITSVASVADIEAARLLGRRRVLVIRQGGLADEGNCQDRVEYERAHRNAKALEASYTLQGWRQDDGALWEVNQLVAVRDPWLGLDREMVISSCTYSLSDGGQLVELTVGPVDGYRTKVAKAAKQKKTGGGGAAPWADAR